MRHDHRAAILNVLSPSQQAYLRAFPLHQWKIGAPGMADYAVHAARTIVAPGQPPTCAAEVLAVELARYAATSWRFDQDKESIPDAPAKQQALHRVLRLRGADRPPSRTTIIRTCQKIECYNANAEIRQ